MIQIKPIKVFGKPDGTQLQISCDGFLLGAKKSIFTWNIYAEIEKDNYDFVIGDSILVDEGIFDKWGTDDTIIINYIIKTIGVEKV